MKDEFEDKKNKKALLYTLIICSILLLFTLISWKTLPPPTPPIADLIEINLGNFDEGDGKIQPLIKGEKAPSQNEATPTPVKETKTAEATSQEEVVKPNDDETDKEAAVVNKAEKKTVKPEKVIVPVEKSTTTKPIVAVTAPKPQKPKIGGYHGTIGAGNGATEDNGYKSQGNKPGGTGDAGSPNGKPDSYGNNTGGKSGGAPRVTKGDRKIVHFYNFQGDRAKATIYAIIKISPDGKGTFMGFDKKSTSTEQGYANDIRQYLQNMQFDKADHESSATVQFNFNVN